MRNSSTGTASMVGRRRAVDRLTYAILIAGALVMVFPFLWMLTTSFKDMGEVRMWPPSLLPQQWDFTNYRDIWAQYPMAQFLWNGFVIASLSTLGTLFSCSLAGFALAQLNFPGRGVLFLVVLCTILLPYQVRMVPIFIEMATLGWIDSFKPLIVPAFFGSAYGIFLMRQFFLGIPRDLKEAAILDGASPFAVFWQIFLPLSKPALTALAIVSFVTSWNDLLAPMIFITTFEKMPIALALSFFKGQGEALWPWLMAASVISMLPLMVVYLAAQRWFIEGLDLYRTEAIGAEDVFMNAGHPRARQRAGDRRLSTRPQPDLLAFLADYVRQQSVNPGRATTEEPGGHARSARVAT